MQMDLKPEQMSPQDFEQAVKIFLESASTELVGFKAVHREKVAGVDGVYEIDVTARFRALGAEFLVLVECKHHRNPIKREIVQVLCDRIRSMGAQKGMIFATSSFQSGAIEYARTHGIALITVAPGRVVFNTFGPVATVEDSPWSRTPGNHGWVVCPGTQMTKESSLGFSCIVLLDSFLDTGKMGDKI